MSLGKGKILACVCFEDVCNSRATSCRHPHVIVVAGCSVVEQDAVEEVTGRIKLSLHVRKTTARIARHHDGVTILLETIME